MMDGTEIKRQWWVTWDNAPDGTQPQLDLEESLVPMETTGQPRAT